MIHLCGDIWHTNSLSTVPKFKAATFLMQFLAASLVCVNLIILCLDFLHPLNEIYIIQLHFMISPLRGF